MSAFAVKLLQTPEGVKFVTVLPPAEPRPELSWATKQFTNHRYHEPIPWCPEEDFGIGAYARTRVDQES